MLCPRISISSAVLLTELVSGLAKRYPLGLRWRPALAKPIESGLILSPRHASSDDGKTGRKNIGFSVAGCATLSCTHTSTRARTDTGATSSPTACHHKGPAQCHHRRHACRPRNRYDASLRTPGMYPSGPGNNHFGIRHRAHWRFAGSTPRRHDHAPQLRGPNPESHGQDSPPLLPYRSHRRLNRPCVAHTLKPCTPSVPAAVSSAVRSIH